MNIATRKFPALKSGPPVSKTTPTPWLLWNSARMIANTNNPSSSNTTPVLLISATTRTPKMFSSVDHHERDERDPLLVGEAVRADRDPDVVHHRQQRQRERRHHGRDGQRARPQVDPAREPRVGLGVAQQLRPLEDRAGEREVRGHLGEDERDDELPEGHHREGPDERPAERADPEDEQGEDARRRRDVAERRGERA